MKRVLTNVILLDWILSAGLRLFLLAQDFVLYNLQTTKFSVITLLTLVFLAACNGNTHTDTTDQSKQSENVEPELVGTSKASRFIAAIEKGKQIYKEKCMACHQENGEGIPGSFPPLAKSDYLLADRERAIKQTMTGSSKEITVNGVKYPGSVMPPQELDDEQTANVMTYILNSWGNQGDLVTIDEVKKVR